MGLEESLNRIRRSQKRGLMLELKKYPEKTAKCLLSKMEKSFREEPKYGEKP